MHRVSRTAIASATNRSDALSVRGDKNEAMRCRKKRSDALSVRTRLASALSEPNLRARLSHSSTNYTISRPRSGGLPLTP